MDYAGKPKKQSQESEYTMLDHGPPNKEGYSGDDGMAEARQDLMEGQNDQEVIKGFTSSLAQGAKEMAALAKVDGPFLMTSLLMYSRNMISLYFLGRQGSVELAGGVLALALANATGFSVIKGLPIGMDPICSQKLGGRMPDVFKDSMSASVAAIPISCKGIEVGTFSGLRTIILDCNSYIINAGQSF